MKKEYDFSQGQRGAVEPLPSGKTRVTIRLDDDVLEWFREQAHEAAGGIIRPLSTPPCASTSGSVENRSKICCGESCAKSCIILPEPRWQRINETGQADKIASSDHPFNLLH